MSIQGPNNTDNEMGNQKSIARKTLKAVRRLQKATVDQLVNTSTAIVNHRITRDAVVGVTGGATIAAAGLSIATVTFGVPAAITAVTMGSVIGGLVPVVGEGIKKTMGLTFQGMKLAFDSVKNIVTPVPQARKGQAPEAQAPEAQAPEAQAPEAQAPEAQAPEAQAPEAQAFVIEASEAQASVAPLGLTYPTLVYFHVEENKGENNDVDQAPTTTITTRSEPTLVLSSEGMNLARKRLRDFSEEDDIEQTSNKASDTKKGKLITSEETATAVPRVTTRARSIRNNK